MVLHLGNGLSRESLLNCWRKHPVRVEAATFHGGLPNLRRIEHVLPQIRDHSFFEQVVLLESRNVCCSIEQRQGIVNELVEVSRLPFQES